MIDDSVWTILMISYYMVHYFVLRMHSIFHIPRTFHRTYGYVCRFTHYVAYFICHVYMSCIAFSFQTTCVYFARHICTYACIIFCIGYLGRHITYFILHITHYISHITYYILHITHYILHITYHISHITYRIPYFFIILFFYSIGYRISGVLSCGVDFCEFHITFDILHITYYISHITYYTSHITYHILHITYHILQQSRQRTWAVCDM